jgi:uncharacterized phosphosugar-binding protein
MRKWSVSTGNEEFEMTKHYADFLGRALFQLDGLLEKNGDTIERAASEIAGHLAAGGRFLLFGCGHSGLVAQDAFYRAGGLRQAQVIFHPRLTLDHEPVAATSEHEKEEGWIVEALGGLDFGRNDALLVISTSGVNAVPVELARHARERGALVVAITSLAYREALAPRHSSGLQLAECALHVLDNLVPYGDSLVEVEEETHRFMGSAGTAAGALLVQALSIAIWEAGQANGVTLPTYVSGNLPGGMERNARG